MKAAKIYNKVLLIIGVFIVSITLGFIGYSISERIDFSRHTYEDYEMYNINYSSIYQMKEPEYFVYMYKKDCTACDKLEYEVTSYLEEYKKGEISMPLYLVDADKFYKNLVQYDKEGNIIFKVDGVGYKNPDDLAITEVPFLLKVVNHQSDSYTTGVNNISKRLKSRI